MSMTQDPTARNQEMLQVLAELQALLHNAATQGRPIHDVERDIGQRLLALGRKARGQFLTRQGDGDLGETLGWPTGQQCQRLDKHHPRRYVSIFGEFVLQRTVYGSREGQQITFVPLDNRLQLPASVYSYVLQDWDQALCVEQAFDPARQTIARLLGLNQSVDSLERMNPQVAEDVADFRENRPMPAADEEGELLVVSADGKGIVMRRDAEAPPPSPHRTKGAKASQKRLATVGAVSTVDRYARTPEEVVAAWFAEPAPGPPPQRPLPPHKHVWASLGREDERGAQSSMDIVYPWLLNEVVERNPGLVKETVYLHDGQEALWEARARHLPKKNGSDGVDRLHVTPRLWQAAHLFYREGSDEAAAFVGARLLRVLQGQAALVLRGLRQMGTKHRLVGSKKRALQTICAYLEANLGRMRYDEYRAKGYPLASGVIDGACRHLVADRMERAGRHWKPAGAQALLEVRRVYLNGAWEA